MKRELARKKLARLREQESKVAIKEEAEETPLARTTIFEKMGARSPTHRPPGRQRTSSQRQHIFQVKTLTESVISRCVIRNVRQIMSCFQPTVAVIACTHYYSSAVGATPSSSCCRER